MNEKLKFYLFLFSSIFVGIINGLFGGGGGMLCVPFLKLFLNLEDKKAHATAVLIMAIISIPTLIVYITTISFNFSQTLFLTIGVLIGGLVGAKLLKNMNNQTINIMFIIIMIVAGVKMLF